MAGPQYRQKLQPRSDQALMNAFNTHYGSIPREGNPSLVSQRHNTFINERGVNGDISHNRINRSFSTHDTQQGNRVNQPGGRASHLLIEQDKTGSPYSLFQRYVRPGGSGYEQYWGDDGWGEEIPFQLKGGGQDYWHTEDTKNQLGIMNQFSDFVQRPEFDMNQPSTWRNGGLVNPHREWDPNGGSVRSSPGPKTRQKLQPRNLDVIGRHIDRYTQEGNFPRLMGIQRELEERRRNLIKDYGIPGEGFIQRPGRPEEGSGGIGPDSFWNVKANQLDNAGIMLALADNSAVNRIQNIYNQVDPFLPEVNWNDQRLGYNINRDLWGGNLNIGGEYDFDDEGYNLGIDWRTSW